MPIRSCSVYGRIYCMDHKEILHDGMNRINMIYDRVQSPDLVEAVMKLWVS